MDRRKQELSEETTGQAREYLFKPALVSALKHGYSRNDLKSDALAGLTVAIVALPLSMALAIASGLPPERGLYTAIVGGFLISLLGGSRFQIGGPAGAFIVLVSLTVERHGYDGLVLATAIAGLIMIAIGVLRLGTYIRYIPHPVTVGFAAGTGTRERAGSAAFEARGPLAGAGHHQAALARNQRHRGGDDSADSQVQTAVAGIPDRGNAERRVRGGLSA
jgi:hypothetical protein